MRRNWRKGILAAAGTIAAASVVSAQPTGAEDVLVRSLDRAFKPGFLSTNAGQKHPDGTYTRLVTTGDAIAKPTFAKPREIAQAACAEAGGTLRLAVSAGRYAGPPPRAVVKLGDQQLDVDYAALYRLFSPFSSSTFDAATSGFRPMFRTSYFADRAAAQADAAPPFGLFTCADPNGAQLWAVAIMPSSTPMAYDLPIRVTPVTRDWIKARRDQAAAQAATAARAETTAARRHQAEIDHLEAEAVRLRPFRAGLKVGSRTNCGIVIAVRGPLLQVQLPPNIIGPAGTREFWAPRDELTDAPPPQGCRFGA